MGGVGIRGCTGPVEKRELVRIERAEIVLDKGKNYLYLGVTLRYGTGGGGRQVYMIGLERDPTVLRRFIEFLEVERLDGPNTKGLVLWALTTGVNAGTSIHGLQRIEPDGGAEFRP